MAAHLNGGKRIGSISGAHSFSNANIREPCESTDVSCLHSLSWHPIEVVIHKQLCDLAGLCLGCACRNKQTQSQVSVDSNAAVCEPQRAAVVSHNHPPQFTYCLLCSSESCMSKDAANAYDDVHNQPCCCQVPEPGKIGDTSVSLKAACATAQDS